MPLRRGMVEQKGGINVNKKGSLLIFLIIAIFLMYNIAWKYASEKKMVLKYKDSDLDPDRFVKDSLSSENQLIVDSNILTDEYRYIYGYGMVGDVITDFVFDTKEESTMDFKEYEEATNKKPDYEVVNYKDGNLIIVDNVSGKIMFEVDLIKEGYITNTENLEIGITWSNEKRYLLLRDLSSKISILVDIKTQSVERILIKDIGVIRWSKNDKKAVLYFTGTTNDVYLWDMETGNIEKIGESINLSLSWTPDGEYIYYFSTYTDSGPIRGKIVRYDVKNKIWEDIYKSKGSIIEESIKWVSGNEFVLTEVRSPKTLNPFRMLLKPHDYYAVKVDVKRNRVKEKKLRAVLARSYAWSYDNKYLYYTDQRGFFKAKVNFD